MLCIIRPGPSRKISVEQRVIITVMTSGGRITWHTSYRARGMLYIITILSSILLLTFLLIPKHLRETLIISSISDGLFLKSKTTMSNLVPQKINRFKLKAVTNISLQCQMTGGERNGSALIRKIAFGFRSALKDWPAVRWVFTTIITITN